MPAQDPAESTRLALLLEATLDAVDTGVMVHDQSDVLFVNRATVSMLGGESKEQFTGHRVAEFIHPDGEAAGAARRRFVLETGQRLEGVPVKLVGIDGVTRYAKGDAQRIEYGEGLHAIMVTSIRVVVAEAEPGVAEEAVTPPE